MQSNRASYFKEPARGYTSERRLPHAHRPPAIFISTVRPDHHVLRSAPPVSSPPYSFLVGSPVTDQPATPIRTVRKMPKSSALSLTLPSLTSSRENLSRALNSPHSSGPRTPRSPPVQSPRLDQPGPTSHFADSHDPHSPITSAPATNSGSTSPKHKKEQSKSIFSNYKAARSTTKVNSTESRDQSRQGKSAVYPFRKAPGSTPELSLMQADNSSISGVSSHTEASEMRNTGSAASNHAPSMTSDTSGSRKNRGHKLPQLLGRQRSVREKEEGQKSLRLKPIMAHTDANTHDPADPYADKPIPDAPMKTAPLFKEDRSFRNMMNSTIRNRSADRIGQEGRERDSSKERRGRDLAGSHREANGFLSNFKDKATDGIGRAGKGIFKLVRSGSSHEKEPLALDAHYENKVINLPLVEQTRKTRISKRLEDSRDKTEYWMPALPWRCIDYLNFKGCDQEGLYRVPGSQRDVKFWERRFDTDLDIDLFNEPDLHDINTIGSLFKTWLRDLPDEILPKSVQARIASQCQGATATPQLLKDELSKLPPFNYYLLFAITCHIALLHSCAKENKMDYRNLCICFQPCMKIDAFCFQFLVLDWRNCWQGCWTEKEYLAKELDHEKVLQEPQQTGAGNHHSHMHHSNSHGKNSQHAPVAGSHLHHEDRAVSSSGSSKPSITRSSTPDRSKAALNVPAGRTTPDDENRAGNERLGRVPELSPVQPLSPIGPIN